jgi:hypothetical protein
VARKQENVKINYLSRDFETIKSELVEHAKRYYPDTYRDFSDAGFGSLMMDAVSYIGDILSFYLDYQANESFLATAIEYENVLKHGQTVGYRYQGARSTFGDVSLYIIVPANTSATGPDLLYAPKLKAGSSFSGGASSAFTLLEDVDFADPTNEVVVATTNATTGVPIDYAIKTTGQVISGELRIKIFEISNFVKFRTLSIPSNTVTEVVSVMDSEGRQYYEVDHLSQNTIYVPVYNTDSTTRVQAPTIMKPFIVPRRYIIRRDLSQTNITFGYGSDSQLSAPSLVNTRDVVLDLHSKTYVTDMAMDPTILIKGDKFGIAPANTSLTVKYRENTSENSNAAAGTVDAVINSSFEFANRVSLNSSKMLSVQSSLEVSNEFPIQGEAATPSLEDLKYLISGAHASQNRAVTAEDFKTLVLSMPPKFGGVQKCSVIQDVDSNLRNINIYVINESPNGFLEQTNLTLKENIKTWLNTKRMINDSVDILDAKVVNLGVKFSALASYGENKSVVFDSVMERMTDFFSTKLDIGEPFSITEIYSLINATPGIVDTISVKVFQKTGAGYSSVNFNVKNETTPDGRFIRAPKNVIFEVKFPSADIQGTIK